MPKVLAKSEGDDSCLAKKNAIIYLVDFGDNDSEDRAKKMKPDEAQNIMARGYWTSRDIPDWMITRCRKLL